MRKAIHDGDHENGVQLIGQVQGLVKEVLPVAVIIQRVMQEAEVAHRQVQSQLQPASAGAVVEEV